MEFIEGGICAAKGFKAAGIHCGIRKNRSKKDLALIYSEKEARRQLRAEKMFNRADLNF